MDTQEAEKKLRSYLLYGIQTELTLAQESRGLAFIIGKHSTVINDRDFGSLFARLQEIFSERETLCVAKIFDRPNKRNPLRSISSILNLIEENADLWSLPERSCLEKILTDNGYDSCEKITNRELALNIVSFYRSDMPSIDKKETCKLSASLDAVFQSRDKVHAHSEAIPIEERTLPTWADTQTLIEYANNFTKTISLGFLEISDIVMLTHETLPNQFEILLGIANLVNDDFQSEKLGLIKEMRRRLKIN